MQLPHFFRKQRSIHDLKLFPHMLAYDPAGFPSKCARVGSASAALWRHKRTDLYISARHGWPVACLVSPSL